MTQQYEGRAVDWSEEYECEAGGDGFTLLVPGIYPFEVTKFERAFFNGGGKIGPCHQANITISVDGVDANGNAVKTTVMDNFKMWDSLMWRMNQLFRSMALPPTGHNDKGNTYSIRYWNSVVGKTGIVEIGNREYNGKKYNSVVKYIAPEDVKVVGPTQQTTAPQKTTTQAPQAPQPMAAPMPNYAPQPQTYQAVQYGVNNSVPVMGVN